MRYDTGDAACPSGNAATVQPITKQIMIQKRLRWYRMDIYRTQIRQP